MHRVRALSVALAGVVLVGAMRVPTTSAYFADRVEGAFEIVAGELPTPTPTPTVSPSPTPTETPTVEPTPTEEPTLVPAEPDDEVIRIAGPGRIETAAEIAATLFSPGVPVAYIATERTFPDALTGGAAAGIVGGPILLTRQDELPSVTLEQLERLNPGSIIVLGGPAAVADSIEVQLQGLTDGPVRRLGGAERIATAALISADHHPEGSDLVYIATAGTFPDALAGGAAAARDGAPVLLVDDTLPEVTAAELQRLNPSRVIVLGGTAVVSDAVQAEIGALTGATTARLAGGDRYGTSAAIAATFLPVRGTAFMATGENFPDALAGVPAAASASAPILLTRPTELPLVIAEQLIRLDPSLVYILGGTDAVSQDVQDAVEDLVVAQ